MWLPKTTVDAPGAIVSKKPSVLFLADHLSYLGGISHGVSTYYLNALPALVAAGAHVTACFLRESPFGIEQLRTRGVETVGLGCPRWSLTAIHRALQIARSRRFDVIHAAQINGSLIARLIGRIKDIPVILHLHDDILPSWPIRFLNRVFARSSDLNICVSSVVSACAEHGYKVPPERQRVVHTGLDLEPIQRFQTQRRQLRRKLLDIADNRPVLGMAGRFFPLKGHAKLVRLLPALFARHPQAVMVFAGDDPEQELCESLARLLGIHEQVRFVGRRNDIPQLMNCFDLLLMPSISEGFGLAAVEALAAGVPVVAFNAGGVREVVKHEQTGLLVTAGDEAGFAAAISRIIEDPALKRSMSTAALADVQRFSSARHAQQLLNLYQASRRTP